MKPCLTLFVIGILLVSSPGYSQPCSPAGNQTSYGTGNVWIGYVYDGTNFNTYKGYVNKGTAGSPDFDESFGGDNVNYATNGCPVNTETFSVRYKLKKNFSTGDYEFTVGGDDGFRLSLDGGSTWVINNWTDHPYTTATYSVHLSGNTNMVLEYYENSGANRVSFSVQTTCIGTGSQTTYGTNNVWRGYVYDGTNFNTYKGRVSEGTASNPSFDENFGGSNTTYPTSSCSVQTETFSVRYLLQKNFANNNYVFVLGGDDGYRLSLDGGATWVIDKWVDQGYNTSSYAATLNGNKNMVIEYYENGGDNRISFSMSIGVLPINLLSFQGERSGDKISLEWETTASITIDHFSIEKSTDNNRFQDIGTVTAAKGISGASSIKFTFTDNNTSNSVSWYRLKMVDLSGEITYSTIVSVKPEGKKDAIEIFPTISDGTVNIRTAGRIINPRIALYDLQGRWVADKKLSTITGGTVVPVSFSHITGKGVFLLRISGDNLPGTTQKLIIR